jgi:hypothetical protein
MNGRTPNNSESAGIGQGRTLAAALAFLLLFCWRAQAEQSLEVAWNPSTAGGVAGYMVYYGNSSSNYTQSIDAGTNTSLTVPGLQEGQTTYMVVVAYNAQGMQSPPSNEISYIVPGALSVLSKAQPRSPTYLSFVAAPGHTYTVQASVNLTTWSTIWRTSATTNGWVQCEDPEGANLKMRFYRLVMQ